MAAYRYALSPSQIEFHYNLGQTMIPIQVATPEVGELFEFYDNSISVQYSHSYPASKSWDNFVTADLYYDIQNNFLQIARGTGNAKTVVLEDLITIPSGPEMDSSRIEWDGDNGITIETSIDGITYTQCTNGQAVPQYRFESFDTSRDLYIRITMSTTDDSKFLPILDNILISFYNNQTMFAQNSPSYFSTLEGESGVTEFEVDLSRNLYPILSRDARNGLRAIADSGFFINTGRLTKTIEFFYTPESVSDSGLISSLVGTDYYASNYSWSSGTIDKTNISAIYVNSINRTSETNVSNVFTAGELHHVIVVFTAPISDKIKFNHSTYGSVSALYQNVILYETAFDSTTAQLHYDLYMGLNATLLNDSSLTVTENSVTPYNNDWLVYQTV